MTSRVWLLAALFLALIFALLQQWAVADYLYWRHEWFDTFMHYLGGLTIGTFLVYLLSRYRPLAFALLFTFVAVGWEVFEFVFGLPRESNYAFDTALDLLMDVMGALTAHVLARVSLWRSV